MKNDDLIERERTHSIIGAFYDVYNALGYGFLEHVYSLALERELRARGHQVGREVPIPIRYKGEIITTQRVDMLVDECIVIENKATEFLPALTPRQTLNYLRATTLAVALILHFGPEPRFYRIVSTRHRSSTEP